MGLAHGCPGVLCRCVQADPIRDFDARITKLGDSRQYCGRRAIAGNMPNVDACDALAPYAAAMCDELPTEANLPPPGGILANATNAFVLFAGTSVQRIR
jgi:hypothetical protein